MYSALYQILTIAAPLVTIPYVSRIFGAENLGVYSYTSTIAHYFLIFAMLGLSTYGSRTIAMNRSDKTKLASSFWEIYFMQVITSVASLMAYLCFTPFFFKEYYSLALILTIYVASSLTDISWFFHGLEKFGLTVFGNSLIKLASIACIFIFVHSPNDLWVYLLIHSVSTFFASSVLWIYLFKTISFVKPRFKNVLKHFKPNIILFIPVVAVSIYKYMDKIMLGWYSKTETGYYENAEKLITLVAGFITSFGTVMLPKVSKLAAIGDKKSIQESINDSMPFVIGLSCAFAFGLSSIASIFVPIYFGDGFDACIPIICCLSFTLLFTSWSNVIRMQFLIPMKKDKIYLIAEFLGAILNLVFNLIFIRMFGAMGAVIGTIVAESTVTIYQTIMVRKEVRISTIILRCLPFFAIGFFMLFKVQAVLTLSSNSISSLIKAIFVGAFEYLLLWYLYNKSLKKRKANPDLILHN